MSTPQPSPPPARSVAAVLKARLDRDSARLTIGSVSSIPDARHVVVSVAGATVTVPRLQSYTPLVGDAVYLLVQHDLVLALGAVR